MGALDSTDARYLAIAREMHRDGDWLVPRLGGAPHLDKPPLAYWASAVGDRFLGPGEFGGRIAQQLALLATALVVAGAARRMAGGAWSLPAALAFLGAGLPFALSRGLATDLLQLALVTPALVLAHDAALARSAGRTCAAFVCLGVAMLAKGPIGLLVAASVWAPFAIVARGGAALPLRGVALGVAALIAIGLPWYALVAAREPGVLGWWLAQLGGRVTGDGVGHRKDALYLVRALLLGLLPFTPAVLLALWRLRPRRPFATADRTDAFLVAWSVAPIAVFSLFATKLASYAVPAVPGAILALVRAASRGLLDDRIGRGAVLASFAIAAAAAGLAGAALLGAAESGRALVPGLRVGGSTGAIAAGAVLVTVGAGGALGFGRIARAGTRTALLATACVSAVALAGVFHAAAPALPTLRDAGRIAASVPGARVVAFSFQPSLFYYAEPAATVYVAGVNGLVEPFVAPDTARRLTLSREDAVALLREEAPAFALVDAWQSADLAALADTVELRRHGRYAFVANPAALRALAAEEASR
jgi:4-amino-4-deoxy-L-arabinose transferase-like glycosyltransferase